MKILQYGGPINSSSEHAAHLDHIDLEFGPDFEDAIWPAIESCFATDRPLFFIAPCPDSNAFQQQWKNLTPFLSEDRAEFLHTDVIHLGTYSRLSSKAKAYVRGYVRDSHDRMLAIVDEQKLRRVDELWKNPPEQISEQEFFNTGGVRHREAIEFVMRMHSPILAFHHGGDPIALYSDSVPL